MANCKRLILNEGKMQMEVFPVNNGIMFSMFEFPGEDRNITLDYQDVTVLIEELETLLKEMEG